MRNCLTLPLDQVAEGYRAMDQRRAIKTLLRPQATATSHCPGRRHVSLQVAGMRAGASSCDPEVMLRCLIIDDSPRFLDAARDLLERQGIRVVGVASNGAEALQRAEELRPDVTLLDIDLGGESGLELARRLHRGPGLAPSPVILISTHAEQDYAELIAASPAIGFLPKAALSAGAIHDLLASHGDGGRGDLVSRPPGR